MENLDMATAGSAVQWDTVLFYLLAMMAIPFAFGVLFDRAIIRSGFLLIGVFGAVCGLFLLLQAQFLALAQLMIYAVGITLIVVIALMLTNPRLERDPSPNFLQQQLGGFIVAGFMFFTIYCAFRSESWPINNEAVSADVQTIGLALTTTYALPFEFASILLLAALVGAVMLAKAEPPVTETIDGNGQSDASEDGGEAPPSAGTLYERGASAGTTYSSSR
jgi:NAD(P)H-quinone oxidoreductase subunit 6